MTASITPSDSGGALRIHRFGDGKVAGDLGKLTSQFGRVSDAFGRMTAQYLRRKNTVMRNPRPIVSFSFDDAPHSAAVEGARILEAAGAVGTYYICGSLCGTVSEGIDILGEADIEGLIARGHEIGCHTYSHVRAPRLGARQLLGEIERNASFARRTAGGFELANFAYPFGAVSPQSKAVVGEHFASCRGTGDGINAGTIDLALLKAVSIYDSKRSIAEIRTWFDRLEAANGWLILYTHDVDERPGRYGTSPRLLEQCVAEARVRRLDISPVREVVNAWCR